MTALDFQLLGGGAVGLAVFMWWWVPAVKKDYPAREHEPIEWRVFFGEFIANARNGWPDLLYLLRIRKQPSAETLRHWKASGAIGELPDVREG